MVKLLISLASAVAGYACSVVAIHLKFRLTMIMPSAVSVHSQLAQLRLGSVAVPAYLTVLALPGWSIALVSGLVIGLWLKEQWLRVAVCWALGFALIPHCLLILRGYHPWMSAEMSVLPALIRGELYPIAIESLGVWLGHRRYGASPTASVLAVTVVK